MIWHTILNILTALIRNALQGKHQCTRLGHDAQWGWEWDCSCGASGSLNKTEIAAINGFRWHLNEDVKATKRFEESVAVESVKK